MNQKRLFFSDGNVEPLSLNDNTWNDDKFFVRIKEEKKFSGAKLFLFVITASVLVSLFSVLIKFFHS
ncbi:MAG: hypothetical protein M1480_15100 [Bacteroidetes bacterium]|nr:hypothetical protein [Bacteroidota bacterium]